MEKIMKVGNLTIYSEEYSGRSLHLIAVNGVDIVAEGVYEHCTAEKAADHLLAINFDIYTISDIRAGIPAPVTEYNGALISGKIAGFSDTEYFKRIDDTKYYKHYTHRPTMAL